MKPAVAALLLVCATSYGATTTRARYLMGTICEITIDGDARQIDAAFAEGARIEQMLSTWRNDSELSAVNRGEREASPELRALLDTVSSWRERTGGAFEPRIRPLVDVWETRGAGAIPPRQAIDRAVASIRSGRAPFEEGGFGKGYAIDRMLQTIDAPHVVINFGGQVAVRGESKVAIADPSRRDVPIAELTLSDASVSTSSGSEKSFQSGGRTFTHLIDPRSGEALPRRGSVSVIATDALTADVLSTALYVMGPSDGLRWANDHRVRALFIDEKGQTSQSQTFQANGSDVGKQIAEMQRQIDILTQEIESLKTPQEGKAVAADQQQYGLGAAASKVYRQKQGVSFGGYGEMLYENHAKPERDRADLLRAVLYSGYKFTDRVLFNSELEVEHASTESGGAVSMEFAYLDFLQKPALNYRAGVVLLPVGLINERHEPTAYLGSQRPAVEQRIIPATWGEIGAGIFGDLGNVSYRAYLVTGLNSAHFDSDEGIREGRQAGGEALAEDFAIAGRADWQPLEGTIVGGSLYSGGSGQGARFRGRVTLGEVHADSKFRGLSLRALYARGSIGDAAAINEANGLDGEDSIGKTFGGWYVESGYAANRWLTPYARYEQLDTQRSVPAGFQRNLANSQNILTIGVAVKPISQTVIKFDYQNISNKAHSGANQWNVALGYIF